MATVKENLIVARALIDTPFSGFDDTGLPAWQEINRIMGDEAANLSQHVRDELAGMLLWARHGKACARVAEAAVPFAKYGEILCGQQVRGDAVMVELFDCKVTVADFRNLAMALFDRAIAAQDGR